MKSVSNSDYRELVSALQERVDGFFDNGDLREYNRYRRRQMLLRKLKRKEQL